jgi:hypothetical protein
MASGTQTGTGGVVDRAREAVSQVAEQAREGTSTLTEKAKEAGSTVVNKADELAGRVGSGMETAAESVRGHAPSSGMIGGAASTVANALESGGRYLEEEGVSGLAGDLTNLIKRNPIPALCFALAVGVLIAWATRSRS